MEKQLHDFFIADRYHSPTNLEDIHRNEIMKEAIDNARKLQSRPGTTTGSSVLAIRKQSSRSKLKGPPSMQSLYHG